MSLRAAFCKRLQKRAILRHAKWSEADAKLEPAVRYTLPSAAVVTHEVSTACVAEYLDVFDTWRRQVDVAQRSGAAPPNDRPAYCVARRRGTDFELYREEATMSRRQDPAIRRFILENVETYPGSITSVAAQMFGMTRTGIARYMKRLIAEELITAKGTTRARRYQLQRRKISDDTA